MEDDALKNHRRTEHKRRCVANQNNRHENNVINSSLQETEASNKNQDKNNVKNDRCIAEGTLTQ